MNPPLDDFSVVLKYRWISCCRQVFVLSTTCIDHRKSGGGHLSVDQSHARPVLTIGSRRSCCMFPRFRPEGSNCRTESYVWKIQCCLHLPRDSSKVISKLRLFCLISGFTFIGFEVIFRPFCLTLISKQHV